MPVNRANSVLIGKVKDTYGFPADHIEQQLGVPIGRMEFVDRLCVILWLPGVAAHPLHPDRGIKQDSHARP